MDDAKQQESFIKFFLAATELVEPQHRTKLPEYIESIKNGVMKGRDLVERNGYGFHPGFEPETAEYAFNDMEWKSSDVLVSAYAKTGTTWVSAIIKHILGRKDPELLKKYLSISQFFLYLEFGPVSKYEVTENLPVERRFFGTHLPEQFVNLKKLREKGVKVIYVFRNPKDQAVSWYNFAMTLPFTKSEQWKDLLPKNEKEFYDLYIAGKQRLSSKKDEGYLEFIREWYEHKNDENILFVMYEDIKKDPKGEIRKLAEFIGENPTEEELDWVVEKTSFSSMKKEAESGLEKSGMVKMFRKGQVGDWRNHLTVAQSELIDHKVEQILGDTDIKFIYE